MVEGNLNGENKIYEAVINLNEKITTIKVDITEIKTKQTLQHNQNQKDIRDWQKTTTGYVRLKTQVFYQWFFISAVFIGIITLFIRKM